MSKADADSKNTRKGENASRADIAALKASLPRRPCVGVMLMNEAGSVFVARRIDDASGAWQMPQGGVEGGEKPLAAALRELKEETGVASVEVVAETAGWLDYDLPDPLIGVVWNGRYRGQKQKWFLLRFTGEDSEIDIATERPEFEAWRWAALESLPQTVVAFKRDVYQAVCAEFAPLVKPA